jgi:hypothetical protein
MNISVKYECNPLIDPLGLIDEIFQHNHANSNSNISNNDMSFGEYQYYEDLLQNDDQFYANVPILAKASLGKYHHQLILILLSIYSPVILSSYINIVIF